MGRLKFILICVAVSFALSAATWPQVNDATQRLAHDVFQQLIEINTTDSVGNVTTAAEVMAQRFRAAGFPDSDIHVLGPTDRKKNLVVRLHGTGAKKPILLVGHLDVVEARREDWTTDPFQFVEKDGYFYGRGTEDMKSDDAIFVATLVRFKQEGYKPDRDIILALTADEEGGKSNGVDWLLQNHRELINAEYALNPDNGAVDLKDGKVVAVSVEPTEKLYGDYQLEVTNPGGHSSRPVPDNAIYHLADAMERLQQHQFPVELNAVTRAYFTAMSSIEKGQTAADMKAILQTPPDASAAARLSQNSIYNALLRTTCVPTRLEAGHANNALPQRATANVNCRILPGHSLEEVRQELVRIVNDPKVTVRYVTKDGRILASASGMTALPPITLNPEVMEPLQQVVTQMWKVQVIPGMDTGASDGVYLDAAGIPSYGITGVGIDVDDIRAHGKDERVRAEAFYAGLHFYYRYLRALTGGKAAH